MTIMHTEGQNRRWAGRFDRLLEESAEGQGPDDCHPWAGNRDVAGYGRYGQARVMRLVLERDGVEIPEGSQPDHTCHTRDDACPGGPTCPHRPCVNRAHLEVVTSLENWERGRSPSRLNRDKTHCPKCGQEYDRVTHTARDGDVRYCGPCNRAWQRARRARRG